MRYLVESYHWLKIEVLVVSRLIIKNLLTMVSLIILKMYPKTFYFQMVWTSFLLLNNMQEKLCPFWLLCFLVERNPVKSSSLMTCIATFTATNSHIGKITFKTFMKPLNQKYETQWFTAAEPSITRFYFCLSFCFPFYLLCL